MPSAGLELLFSRDLITKYVKDGKIRDALARFQKQWQVIGSFDFLEVHSLGTLEDLIQASQLENGSQDDDDLLRVGIGAHSGLALFPLDRNGLPMKSPTEAYDAYESFVQRLHAGQSCSEHAVVRPLLIGARICLSPIAYELVEMYDGVLAAIGALVRHAAALLPPDAAGEDVQFFRSLSSPEVVVLAMPKSDAELRAVDRSFQRLRSYSMNELAKQIRSGPDERTLQHPGDLPGHALSALDEFLAFRLDGDGRFHWQDDPSRPLDITVHMRVDVGHENWVKSLLKGDDQTPGFAVENRHTWDRFPVRVEAESLTQMVEAWRKLSVNADLRQANLVDSHTTIAFDDVDDQDDSGASPTPFDGHSKKPAWELAFRSESQGETPTDDRPEPIWNELSDTCKALMNWSKTYLSPSQHDEFVGSLRTFRSCFLHQELATAARDLLPFMRQLSFACSDPRWADYRRQVNSEIFSAEVTALIDHLHRAVRNRLEHRSQAADPTNPHTLEHGACKLVNAYTAIYWFVSELFSRPAGSRGADHAYCLANNLAVAVASGSQGRIACRELFAGFRSFLEERLGHRISQQTGRNAWTSRLLLLEVSGRTLFHPEFCLVHCGHEVAEFSDWMVGESTKRLRRLINDWITGCFVDQLCELALEQVLASSENYKAKAGQLKGELARQGLSALEAERLSELQGSFTHDLEAELLNHLTRSLHVIALNDDAFVVAGELSPVEFCRELVAGVNQRLVLIDNWRTPRVVGSDASRKPADDSTDEPGAAGAPLLTQTLINAVAFKNDFEVRARNLTALVQELSADIGMWCALDHLLSQPIDGKLVSRTTDDRLQDVHWIFSSIVQSHVERCRNSTSKDDAFMFLMRWAFQAAAVAPDQWRTSLIRWIDAHRELPSHRHLNEFHDMLKGANGEVGTAWALEQIEREHRRLLPSTSDRPDLPISLVAHLGKLADGEKSADGENRNCHYAPSAASASSHFEFPGFISGDSTLGPAERQLCRSFIAAWKARLNSQEDGRTSAQTQIELVFQMWAKASRLRYPKAFRTDPSTVPDGVS